MDLERTQSALILKGKGDIAVAHDLCIPSPDPEQVLIRTHAVALNPSDWMARDQFYRVGAGMGYEFAGEIVEIGPTQSRRWAVGGRVAGMVHACHAANYSAGAFREYLTADADLVIPLPDSVPFAEGSTVGMGISTAAQALYQSLSLPLPDLDTPPSQRNILVFGGSTSTGSLAIQLAKLSGLRVITTCSASNMQWIASLGPDMVVDYADTDAVTKIRSFVGTTGLSMVLDCVAKDDTAAFCYECFMPSQEQTTTPETYTYASLMSVTTPTVLPASLPTDSTIVHKLNMVYTCFGRRFNLLGRTWEPSSLDREFMAAFYEKVGSLLVSKAIRLMTVEVKEGGLAAIPRDITALREGKVRGKKWVYRVQDASDACAAHEEG